MPADDIFEVSLIQQGSGGINAVNVFHFRQTSADVTDHRAENDLADIIDTQLVVLLTAITSDEWYYRRVRIRKIAPTVHGGFDFGLANNQGSLSEPSYPPDHGVDVKWTTILFTRKGRGRNRFPGVALSQAHGGLLSVSALTLWNTAMAAWIVERTGTNGYKFHFCVCNNAGENPFNVIHYETQAQMKTVRSRTEGNGW